MSNNLIITSICHRNFYGLILEAFSHFSLRYVIATNISLFYNCGKACKHIYLEFCSTMPGRRIICISFNICFISKPISHIRLNYHFKLIYITICKCMSSIHRLIAINSCIKYIPCTCYAIVSAGCTICISSSPNNRGWNTS